MRLDLNLLDFTDRLVTETHEAVRFIFDPVRKKKLIIIPEEWVRQNFLRYLVQAMQYPASLMAIEKTIALNTLKKRCDIVVYKMQKPWMIIECKEVNVPLTPQVLQQVIQYNMARPANYLVVTNGSETRGFMVMNNTFAEIDEWPVY